MILIILAGICAAVGAYFRAGLFRRVVILREVRYMLDEITVLIRFKGATVREIADSLCADSRLCDLTFIKTVSEKYVDGVSFSRCWETAVSGFSAGGLSVADIKLIENIGRNLGTTDIEGQVASLALYKNEAETAYKTAEAEAAKKAKLYTSMGILAGTFLLVFLI
ncbi:MAG: stage III sporulation protein AB [Ruminococcus sp.]|nr:stage III sporulation protein AB [Ruminococcus sp.]